MIKEVEREICSPYKKKFNLIHKTTKLDKISNPGMYEKVKKIIIAFAEHSTNRCRCNPFTQFCRLDRRCYVVVKILTAEIYKRVFFISVNTSYNL